MGTASVKVSAASRERKHGCPERGGGSEINCLQLQYMGQPGDNWLCHVSNASPSILRGPYLWSRWFMPTPTMECGLSKRVVSQEGVFTASSNVPCKEKYWPGMSGDRLQHFRWIKSKNVPSLCSISGPPITHCRVYETSQWSFSEKLLFVFIIVHGDNHTQSTHNKLYSYGTIHLLSH